jgi:hypothetical protein
MNVIQIVARLASALLSVLITVGTVLLFQFGHSV